MRLLSFPLGPESPTFLDNPPVVFREVSAISKDGVANWFEFTTINHNGTHVDLPFHYWDQGPRVTDLSIDDYIFNRPLLIDVPKGDGELIHGVDLAPYADRFAAADLLLLRTGYGQYRSTDRERFGRRAPGFHPDCADVLLAPSSRLRAVAFDFASASSPVHMDEGNAFHREVLGTTGRGRYLLIIEDARIDPDLTQADVRRVFVVPLFLTGADAAPCTLIAEP